MSNALLNQQTRETQVQENPNARVDQLVRESGLVDPVVNARVDQLVRESGLVDPVVNARVDQLVREVWVPISAQLDQLVREVWVNVDTCETTFLQMRNALAARLNDLSKIFWTDAELKLYIIEALRTWNALTATWNADYGFTIVGPATLAWYPLRTEPGYPRQPVMLDTDLYTIMQYHLMEPATGAGTWTGTSQFALSDLVWALQKRRDETIEITASNIKQISIPASVGVRRSTIDNTILEILRARYVPGAGSPVTLWRGDALEFQDFAPNYLQGNPSSGQQAQTGPQQYDQTSNPPLNLDVDYPPTATGIYDLIVLQTGTCPNPPFGVGLGMPDDWTWVGKWGALADLLGSEGERQDAERAAYALARYKDGLTLMAKLPWLLVARINGVPVDTVAMTEMDQYAAEWDSSPNAPPMVVQAGQDFIALSPITPAATSVTVFLTVVGNAPIPVADGDTIPASRDVLDAILDYAQHLCCFKMGGQEFQQSIELAKSFFLAAMATNYRLEALGVFRDILLDTGQKETSAQERFAEQK